MNEDAYFKKTVTFRAWKRSLQFRVSQELFSSHDVDLGTKLLLRTIIEAGYDSPQKVLDVGCGYGPLGITLKSIFAGACVHMIDRDALAVEYSRQNAALNKLTDIEAYGGLGYDDLKTGGFDLIVSNIPGKAGEPVISYLLREAENYLPRTGVVAVVVVKPLEQFVRKVLEDTPAVTVLLERARPGHTVFHYRFTDKPPADRPDRSAFERGVYERARSEFRIGKLEFPIRAAYGLSEFDTLSYGSELIGRALQGLPKSSVQQAVIFNPGQGHLAVAAWKLFQPGRMVLAGRDLLALRYSQLNLSLNKCPPERIVLAHQPGLALANSGETDLFVVLLREESRGVNNMVVRQASENLSKNGKILVSASSTVTTRLIDDMKGVLKVKLKERWRGNTVLVLVK